eukprot:7559387-Pyramimonas_sp.AAC.1
MSQVRKSTEKLGFNPNGLNQNGLSQHGQLRKGLKPLWPQLTFCRGEGKPKSIRNDQLDKRTDRQIESTNLGQP